MERSAQVAGDRPAHAARGWVALGEALDELTAVRATGALHVDGAAGGSIYLIDGEVYYVHAEAAPGVDCLLQASGTVPASVFQTAWAAGAAAGQVGEVLVSSGAVSRGEAELCTTAAIADGAFALLTTEAGPVRFAPGERHWWGALRRVGVAALDDQVRKRHRLLERTPPRDLDDQPVVAARRLGRHHVVLTDLQWELIVHADGRRTPRELAKLLGRSAFSAMLETRRLVTAGLVRVAVASGADPHDRANPADSGAWRAGIRAAGGPPPAAGATGAEPNALAAGKAPLPTRTGSGRRPAAPGDRRADQARRPEPEQHPERAHPVPLPRRQPGAALKGAGRSGIGSTSRTTTADADGTASQIPAVPEPDLSLLARVRTALEGLR